MAIESKFRLENYEYGVHVRKGRQLYMMSDKKIYFGEWMINRHERVIIIEMQPQIAEREAPFYREINGHDYIIRTFGLVENPTNLTIYVQEYAPQGDLADCLMDNQYHFTQIILVYMFRQIADAMSYVARNKIVHGDLGCRNVLVFQVDPSDPRNNLVKLTDFGLARWLERPPTHENPSVIPTRYCAPEILQSNHHGSYSEKSDVYSMGVLIWEALSNSEIPYSAIADDSVVARMKQNNEKLPQPNGCDRQLWELMNSCWNRKPEERPTFDDIRDRLSNMNLSEVSHDLITASSHRPKIHFKYKLNIDVEVTDSLNNRAPSMHEARWISKDNGKPIVIIEKNEEPSEYEQAFYSKFKNHPQIVHTYGYVGNDRGSIMILQERAPHGNLKELLESGRFKPSIQVLIAIFKQILNVMIDVVGQGLVHGDLRCENILVFEMHPTDPTRNLIKLSNFSLAHPNDPSYTDDRRINVPIRYCAPQILRSAGRTNYSEYSDVYSMGVLMWEALSGGKRPYDSSKTNGEVRQRKLKREKLPRPLLCDDQLWQIITEYCWLESAEIQFTFKELQTQFSKINLDLVEPYKYELNVNVRTIGPLNGTKGRFYEAEWIPKKNPPIVLLAINGPTAEQEALFYLKLNTHPHIIQTFGLVKNDRQSIMLIQDRAPHGNLQTALQNTNFQPSLDVFKTIFLQIIDAMIYITNQGIMHGDLCCSNILVFKMHSLDPRKNLVRLTNFSSARANEQLVLMGTSSKNSIQCRASEIFFQIDDGSHDTEMSDIYSMGLLMWQALSKEESLNRRPISDNHDEFSKPNNCPDNLWTLIKLCWLRTAELQLTFKELQSQLSQMKMPKIEANMMSDGLDNEGYESDHLVKKRKPSKRIPIKSSIKQEPPVDPNQPIPYPACRHCDSQYPDFLIQEHEKKCVKPPSPPNITIPDKPFYIPCERCNQPFLHDKIIDHQRICRPTPPTIDQSTSQNPNSITRKEPTPYLPEPKKNSTRTRRCPCSIC